MCSLSPPSPLSHLSADVLRLLWELVRVLLLVLAHSSVHLLPLDALLALAEGRLALYHLKDQAAQPPPVRADGVALILDHLGSWGREMRSEKGVQRGLQSESSRTSSWGGVESCDLYREGKGIVAVISVKKNKEGYPCIQQCPLSLVSSLLQGFEQQDPGLKSGCVLHKNQRLII